MVEPWRRWADARLVLFFFLVGAGAGIYLYWPALTEPSTYKRDMRQGPHWAAFHETSFRDDDPILEYAHFNVSPLQNSIYWVATLFGDVLWVSKVMTVIGCGLLPAIFFVVGRLWFGARFGALLALFITFFPDQFYFSAGFFSKFWMIPSILVAVFLLSRRWWRGLVLLMPFCALAYPVSAVVVGLISAIYLVMIFFEERRAPAGDAGAGDASVAPTSDGVEPARLFRYLAIGSAIAIAILAVKYASPPDFIGPMRPRAEILEMPEMVKGGMNNSPYVPIPSLFDELEDRLWHPFVLFSACFYFLVLGRRGIAWQRSWTALFLAAVIGYLVADVFFMRLYIPNRYTRYSLAVLVALWNARNWDLILARVPSRLARVLMVGALIVAGGFAYRDTFRQGKDTSDRSRYDELCEFVATLPEGILVAGPPRRLDDIMLRSKRSVLTTYKLAHPWFRIYYAMIEERTKDDLRALFADNPDPVNALHADYGVTHLVVEYDLYRRVRRRKRIYVQPYDDFIMGELNAGNKTFMLERPPAESILFRSNKYMVIELPLPETATSFGGTL